MSLSPEDAELLAFERAWWSFGAGKDEAIRETLGMTSSDYYRRLGDLIDTAAALATDPLLVRRLRRQRSARRQERAVRRNEA